MKLCYGVGYNSQGSHKTRVGENVTKAHSCWMSMMHRCYNDKFHQKQPTYKNCTVHPNWHDFQDFADWFYSHPYSLLGYELDKDLLLGSNKIYSEENCCFVPHELNAILCDSGKIRGAHPMGVSWHKQASKYRAYITINNRQKHLGLFRCPDLAHQAYIKAKEQYVKDKALEWQDRIAPEVFEALMAWELQS